MFNRIWIYSVMVSSYVWIVKFSNWMFNVHRAIYRKKIFVTIEGNIGSGKSTLLEKLKEFYSATRACLTKGNKQIGTMFFYGTGGNINKGSKDFMEMWNEPDSFNFIKFI
jgi:ABC-type phosphate transport system ATPase subunit